MSSNAMTTPQSTGNSEFNKRDDIENVPFGLHPVICTGVIDLGTQRSVYQGKENVARKLLINFEFPNHRQLFYEKDTEPRPSMLSMEFIWAMYKTKNGKRTKFLEFCEGLFGVIQESEYATFDVSKLLNNFYVASVEHYNKLNGTVGARIKSVTYLNPAQWNINGIERYNDLQIFSLNHGFQSPNFAALPSWIRKTLKISDEGVAYAQAGNKFYKLNAEKQLVIDDEVVVNNNAQTASQTYNQAVQTQQSQPQPGIAQNPNMPSAPAAPPAPAVQKKWLYTDFTYDQMIAAGWSDEALVSAGYMQIVQPTPPPPAPVANNVPVPPQPPVAPQAPQAPAPVAANAQTTAAMQFSTGTVNQPVANVSQQQQPGIPQAPMNSNLNASMAQPKQPQPAAAPFSPAPGFNAAASTGINAEEHDDLPF